MNSNARGAGRRGRSKRPRTTAEKLLMGEVSQKFGAKRTSMGARAAARELKVSVASFYNYLRKTDLPSFEVLKRAHDIWGENFTHIDFASTSRTSSPSEESHPRQYILPFIKAIREDDIEIIRAKAVKPDSLLLTLKIKFVS
jgi:hypothetical protein